MITREKDYSALYSTMEPFLPIVGLDLPVWLANPLNVALTDGNGNYSLFERQMRGVVAGHYFMKARGRESVRTEQN